MFLIEPCCTPKHLQQIRGKIGEGGTTFFHGYGDMSIAELLPHLLTRYDGVELMIVAPSLPAAAAEAIAKAMDRRNVTRDGKGMIYTVGRLTIVTDLRKKKSPQASAWLTENPWGDRLKVVNTQQNDTAVLLPDIAIFGNVNLSYGGHFTCVATRKKSLIEDLRRNYLSLGE